MTVIDYAGARQFFLELQNLVRAHHDLWNSGAVREGRATDVNDRIRSMITPARTIAAQLDPAIAQQMGAVPPGGWEWATLSDSLVGIIGVIDQRERVEAIIGPRGPALAADRLHPRVWQASAPLWDGGNFRMAIQAAATAVDSQLKVKLRVDRSGTDLVTKAFSTRAPTPDEPRLRFRGFSPGTESWTNAHEGALHFARGCAQRIRNLATHEEAEPEEQVALEQLAALSVLARWIDDANVERVDSREKDQTSDDASTP
jgi:hypothetical protein